MINRIFPTLIMAAAFAFPSSTLAQDAPPPVPVAPAPPPAVREATDGQITQQSFCNGPDVTAEVGAFCPKLAWFQNYVNTHKSTKTPAELLVDERTTLSYLDPSDFKAQPFFIAAVKNSSAMQELKAAAVSAVETFAKTVPVTNADLQQAADATNTLRSDQQLTTGPASAGTTSLVTKSGSAALISLAVDAGALTRSVNGSTVTLIANTDEIYRVLTRQHGDCMMNCGNMAKAVQAEAADAKSGKKISLGNYTGKGVFERTVLDRLNLSAAFDLAQSDSQVTATSGQASGSTPTPVAQAAIPTGAGKLTSFTAKYAILNKFDPRSTDFRTKWIQQATAIAPQTLDLSRAVQALYNELTNDPAFKAATQADDTNRGVLLQAALNDPTGTALVASWEKIWQADTATALTDANLPALVSDAVAKQEVFSQAWKQAVVNTVGAQLTIQYVYNKPLDQPHTHDITGIYAYDWGPAGSLTMNGSVSLYDGALPPNAQYGHVHFGQFSGQYDNVLHKSATAKVELDYSLAGYWQYQPQPSILNIPAGTVAPGTAIPLPNGTQEFVGTAGSLWVGQGKITIRGPKGINLPLAASWSNKTDLLQGSKWGGQVGISYDFTSLAGLFH